MTSAKNKNFVFIEAGSGEGFDKEAGFVWRGIADHIALILNKPLIPKHLLPTKFFVIPHNLETLPKLAYILKNINEFFSIEDLMQVVDVSDMTLLVAVDSAGFLKYGLSGFYGLSYDFLKIMDDWGEAGVVVRNDDYSTPKHFVNIVLAGAKQENISIHYLNHPNTITPTSPNWLKIERDKIIDENVVRELGVWKKGEQYYFVSDNEFPYFVFYDRQKTVIPLLNKNLLVFLSALTKNLPHVTPAVQAKQVRHEYQLNPRKLRSKLLNIYKYYNIIRYYSHLILGRERQDAIKKLLTTHTPKETIATILSSLGYSFEDNPISYLAKNEDALVDFVLRCEDVVRVAVDDEYVCSTLDSGVWSLSFYRALSSIRNFRFCTWRDVSFGTKVTSDGQVVAGLSALKIRYSEYKKIVEAVKSVKRDRDLRRDEVENEIIRRIVASIGKKGGFKRAWYIVKTLIKRGFFRTMDWNEGIAEFLEQVVFYEKLANGRCNIRINMLKSTPNAFFFFPDKPKRPKKRRAYQVFRNALHFNNLFLEQDFVTIGYVRDDRVYIHPAVWMSNKYYGLGSGVYDFRVFGFEPLAFRMGGEEADLLSAVKELYTPIPISFKTPAQQKQTRLYTLKNSYQTLNITPEHIKKIKLGYRYPIIAIVNKKENFEYLINKNVVKRFVI